MMMVPAFIIKEKESAESSFLYSVLKQNSLMSKVLIIGGSKDPVSNFSKGLISLNNEYRKYGINSRLIIYENMRHEIINEKNNDEVFENIKDFYEE